MTKETMPLDVRKAFFKAWFVTASTYADHIWRAKRNKWTKRIDGIESYVLKRIMGVPSSISHDSIHMLSGILPGRYRTIKSCAVNWKRIKDFAMRNDQTFETEFKRWLDYGLTMELIDEQRLKRPVVSLYRRLNLITETDLGMIIPQGDDAKTVAGYKKISQGEISRNVRT